MIGNVERWAAAQLWRAARRVEADRHALYGGAHGLRIACFHDTPPPTLTLMERLVAWWRPRHSIAAPSDADALFDGTYRAAGHDRMLFTFDDGLESNYAAALWLARRGIRAIFFVVPSLVGRTIGEYLRYHEYRGVTAHAPVRDGQAHGLSVTQVREMAAMGHRIAAHNYAHRDLGTLHDEESLRYEVDEALHAVAALTGKPCRDFALGFGQPENVSPEAAQKLIDARLHVYACHRGLNVPGRTPRFLLRHACEPSHPLAFTQACLAGGADRRLWAKVEEMIARVDTLPGARQALIAPRA